MATILDVLQVIDTSRDGAMLAGCVADKLWPGQRFNKPHHGGPHGGQRAAAGLLGRMAKRGLVTKDRRSNDPRTYWRLTQQGRNMLRSRMPPNPAPPLNPIGRAGTEFQPTHGDHHDKL